MKRSVWLVLPLLLFPAPGVLAEETSLTVEHVAWTPTAQGQGELESVLTLSSAAGLDAVEIRVSTADDSDPMELHAGSSSAIERVFPAKYLRDSNAWVMVYVLADDTELRGALRLGSLLCGMSSNEAGSPTIAAKALGKDGRVRDLVVSSSDLPREMFGPARGALGLTVARNPSLAPVAFRYRLPVDAHVALGIYDTSGRRIRILESGSRLAGDNAAQWDGDDARGNPVTAGVYFVRLSIAGNVTNEKFVLIRE